MRIGVVDYGVGNLGSVLRALEELRATPYLVSRASDLRSADRLILPGVGNFADCVRLLEAGGWISGLKDEVLGKTKPLLGICLGMQLLASFSMEGAAPSDEVGVRGLGLIPGKVVHLRSIGCQLRVPHVGWNGVSLSGDPSGLFENIPDGTDFYFVHSYAFVPDDPAHVAGTADYDVKVTAAVKSNHVCGTQFHPEKSSRAGFRVLSNFIWGAGC